MSVLDSAPRSLRVGPRPPRRGRRRLARGWVLAAVGFVCVVSLVPFLYVLSSAFKSSPSLFTYPPQWIPTHPTFHNFAHAFDRGFATWTFRTLLISVVFTALKLWFDSMAAYAFAKLRFPGRRVLFAAMVLTVMVPPIALIIPLYFIVRDLGGLDTYWALIVPPMANPIGIFMLRGFIETLPGELEQAARVDGASAFTTYRQVILPLIKPGLVVVGLYLFLVQYTNFVWPLVIAPDKTVLTTGLASLQPLLQPDWGLISAASLLTMVPITVIFLLFQRQFISVSVADALKG